MELPEFHAHVRWEWSTFGSSMFTIYILERSALHRRWLRYVLANGPWRYLGGAGNLEDALLHFPRGAAGPDVLLLGTCRDGTYHHSAAIRLFGLVHPRTRIVLLDQPFGTSLPTGGVALQKPFSPVQLTDVLTRITAPENLP